MNSSPFPASSGLGDFAGPPPVLVVASSGEAHRRASDAIHAGGYRPVPLTLDEAGSRIEIQPAASGIWVEVDKDGGVHLDWLIDRMAAEAESGRFPSVVSAPFALLDSLEWR